MKRIIMVLMLAALMLAMSALPALAKNSGTEGGGPPESSGNPEGTEVFHCKSFGGKSSAVFHEKDNKITGNCRLA
jgi:hypothetical protein